MRVISFDEGLVLDVSSLRDDEGNAAQFDIAPFSEYIDDAGFEIGEFLPIIAIVSHRDELKQISDMFRYRYGVKLNGKPVNVSPNRGNDKKSKKKSKVPKT